MNKIIITGRIVNDLEIKAVGSGTEVCNFTVAVDRRYKKDGEERQTDFFDCTVFNKSAAFLTKYFHKGDGINIEGRMESRIWEDKDGKKRKRWSILCDNIEFPHGKAKGGNAESGANTFTEIPDEDDGKLPF